MLYFIELSYRGTHFFGWQRQPEQISVQEVIEDCLSKTNGNRPITIYGCGRTDTGVHAKHFVAHAEMQEIKNLDKYVYKLNRMLPADISIHRLYEVEPNQHARFSAKSRTYRYYVHSIKDPFKEDLSWKLKKELNFAAMNEAAKHLIGTKDFTSLSKLHTSAKTNICTITKAEWIPFSETEAYFEISADRFLRNMVRATVGTLMEVGLDRIKPDEILGILAKKDRQEASTSVPAHGLYLWEIEY